MRPARRTKRFQHQHFASWQVHEHAVHARLAVGLIEGEPSGPDHRPPKPPRPAQDGAQARQQFFHREGLGEIIVGARVQSLHAVLRVPAGGEHDHRQDAAPFRPFPPQGAQEIQALSVRQVSIQQNGIVAGLDQCGLGIGEVRHMVEQDVVPMQSGAQRRGHFGFVFHQEQAHRTDPCFANRQP